jgi:hypothetical protein
MRKLVSLTMTAIALGEGALAIRRFLRKLRVNRMMAEGAMEVRTPDGNTVIYKPVNENGDCADTVAEAKGSTPKPHQDKPSQMGLA